MSRLKKNRSESIEIRHFWTFESLLHLKLDPSKQWTSEGFLRAVPPTQ